MEFEEPPEDTPKLERLASLFHSVVRRGKSDSEKKHDDSSSGTTIEDEFNETGTLVTEGQVAPESPEKRSFAGVLDAVLPWRDASQPAPHVVDLRGSVAATEDGETAGAEIVQVPSGDGNSNVGGAGGGAAEEVGVVEKLLRLLPIRGSDMVVALDVTVLSMTGETIRATISQGPVAELATRIRRALLDQMGSRSRMSTVSLERMVQHMHISPAAESRKKLATTMAGTALPGDAQHSPVRSTTGNSSPKVYNSGNNSPTFAAAGRPSSMDLTPVMHHHSAPALLGAQQQQQQQHHVLHNEDSMIPTVPTLLSRIPPAVAACRRMTVFVIEGQQLTSAEDILVADLLEELRIIKCDLREVPQTLLVRLPRLRVLDFRGNFLTSVVLNGSHEKLQSISFAENQIATLPSFISRVPSITSVDVSFNKLSSLPSDMRHLTNLVSLNLEGNALVTPSAAIIRGMFGSIDVLSRFPRLAHLNLAKNRMTELPSTIDLLGCLNELLIGDNKLARIPVQILTIPNLAVVDVSGNPLGPSSPPELALVKNTNTLRIARAGLKNFPPNLPSLSHLVELDLSNNKIKEVDPSLVFGMHHLAVLDMSGNLLETAEFIVELQGLCKLNMSKNLLKSLPAAIENLEKLRELNVSNNRLTALPESFARLYNLESFDVSLNGIETLGIYWNASSFPNLKCLLLEGNPRAATSLHFSFCTLRELRTLSMLGMVIDVNNLFIQNPGRFDLALAIQVASNVRHPLLLSAFFGLASIPEYKDRILGSGGVELMLSLCEVGLNNAKPLLLHEAWPPADMFQPDTARYQALRTMTALTTKMDANVPRWVIFQHGAPAILMDIINKHPDVRYKLICIRLLGNLALHTTLKSQIFHEKSELVAYLEDLALTSHSDSIRRFCNRTFAIFGITQHVDKSLSPGGRRTGIRVLALDGGGTRSLVTVEILARIREITGKQLSDMFDLIVGTSAGGLVALSLLIGKTLEEMADVYLNRGYLCFSPQDEVGDPPTEWRNSMAWNKTIRPMINLATKGAMYRVKTYERELKRYFGSSTMISTAENERNPRVAVVTTLTSVKPAVPYLCRNYDYAPQRQSRYSGDLTWRIWEVARATSAAPSFFDPFEREGLQLIDGGIVANNPSVIAYHEARRIWGNEVPISLILSVGTGCPQTVPMGRDRGIMETVEQLVDAALSQDRAHEAMLDLLPPEVAYFRLQPTGPSFGTRLDEIRKSELLRLQEAARKWVLENDEVFQKIKTVIMDDAEPVGAPVKWKDDSTDDTNYLHEVSTDDDLDDDFQVSVGRV